MQRYIDRHRLFTIQIFEKGRNQSGLTFHNAHSVLSNSAPNRLRYTEDSSGKFLSYQVSLLY